VARTTENERREDARTAVSWPVRLWVDEQLLVGEALDVSAQGLCVLTAPTEALKRGASHRIDVMVGAEPPMALPGEVRHAERLRLP